MVCFCLLDRSHLQVFRFIAAACQVAKQSKAAMSMCLWVRAMDTYAKVIKIVEPKRQMLREAQVRITNYKRTGAG